eukprot:SAG11_NODE_733_length_7467_cov_4.673453_2_plen_31_part_00
MQAYNLGGNLGAPQVHWSSREAVFVGIEYD